MGWARSRAQWTATPLRSHRNRRTNHAIQVDKGRMRLVPLKEKIGIHSSSLSYDEERNELLGYGGTNVDSSLPARLYRLNLDQKESYEW